LYVLLVYVNEIDLEREAGPLTALKYLQDLVDVFYDACG